MRHCNNYRIWISLLVHCVLSFQAFSQNLVLEVYSDSIGVDESIFISYRDTGFKKSDFIFTPTFYISLEKGTIHGIGVLTNLTNSAVLRIELGKNIGYINFFGLNEVKGDTLRISKIHLITNDFKPFYESRKEYYKYNQRKEPGLKLIKFEDLKSGDNIDVQAADSIKQYAISINGKVNVITLKPKVTTRSYRVYCGHSHHLSYQIKSWFRKGKPLKYKGFSETVTERGIIWVGEFYL